jgi:YfiH family protein
VIATERWDTGVVVRHGTTTREDGDFAIDADPAALARARRAVADLPWVWLRQVHGAQVHRVVAGREDDVRGRDGDALVTSEPGIVLAVQTADCVPLTFSSREGVIGVAHAGWRGIESGVIQATVGSMRAAGATWMHASVGPCIHAECYEFGDLDLDRLVTSIGPEVEGRTADGGRALDAVAAVDRILADLEVTTVHLDADRSVDPGAASACTGCRADTWYSHRARGEAGRMATVIWREPDGEAW